MTWVEVIPIFIGVMILVTSFFSGWKYIKTNFGCCFIATILYLFEVDYKLIFLIVLVGLYAIDLAISFLFRDEDAEDKWEAHNMLNTALLISIIVIELSVEAWSLWTGGL